jgi:hypothetical protein
MLFADHSVALTSPRPPPTPSQSSRTLSPALPSYSYRWLTLLLSADLPYHALAPVWDLILSEPHSKLDLLLDVCTALLILAKPALLSPTHGLWTDLAESSIRGLELLRNYPIDSVGVDAVLRVAWEIRQQRLLATSEGEGPDDVVWPERGEHAEDAADTAIARIESVATAALAKAKTNLMARWMGAPSAPPPPRPPAGAPDGAPSATPPSDLSSRLAALTLPTDSPGADLYRRDTSMPPSFISPRGSIVYPAGRYRRRAEPRSISGRLTALAGRVVGSPPSSPPAATKPLLLSASARPATSPRMPASASLRPVSTASDSGSARERVALRDPGAVTSADESESSSTPAKYQLTDLPTGIPDLRRRDSSDSQADVPPLSSTRPGIARRQVIKKRQHARPPNLKLTEGTTTLDRADSASTTGSRAGDTTEQPERTPRHSDFQDGPSIPTPRLPRSPRRAKRPTSDGALADNESDDAGTNGGGGAGGDDSAVKEQDGYGDLLEAYGKIAEHV